MKWSTQDKRIQLFGERIRQSWVDLFFINRVLSTYEFDHIVEIGTGHGMLSVFLRMHSNDAPVTTIDIRGTPKNETFRKLQDLYGINDYKGDCFEEPYLGILKQRIQSGRTLTYCDGGDKTKELSVFAPYLGGGDVIMCHDKGSKEAEWDNIKKIVQQNNLKPFHQKEADELQASIWSFIK